MHTLTELRKAAQSLIDNPSTVLREIDKQEIRQIVKENHHKNDALLPKDLKQHLAKEYCYSEKTIEAMIYEQNGYCSGN